MTGDYHKLDQAFQAELQELEHDLGFALNVNSGKRDAEHNLDVGGVRDSAHTEEPCKAADIAVSNGYQRYAIVYRAIECGFKRIGVAKTFIHLDRSSTLPSPVIWTYDVKG
jgi:hypothetical protein